MGDNSVGKVFSILLCAILPFFLLAMHMYNIYANVNTVIRSNTASFVDNCSANGKIDANEYLKYCDSIYKLGNYKIVLMYEEEKDFYETTNGYRREKIATAEDEILNKMFPNNEKKQYDYNLSNHGHLTVKVLQVSPNPAESLLNALFLSENGNHELIVRYGKDIGHTSS